MLRKKRPGCTDPGIGRFLQAAMSGSLSSPSLEEERRRFLDHIKICKECRDGMLEQANEIVVIPTLQRLAREKGVSFEELARGFARVAREMLLAGRFKELSQQYQSEAPRDQEDETGAKTTRLS